MTSRPLVDVSERAAPAALAEHVLFRGREREEGTFGGDSPGCDGGTSCILFERALYGSAGG
jgi:hypothetical protein